MKYIVLAVPIFLGCSSGNEPPIDATVLDNTIMDRQMQDASTLDASMLDTSSLNDASYSDDIPDRMLDLVEECTPQFGSWPCDANFKIELDGPQFDAGAVNTESGLVRSYVSSDITVAGSYAVGYDAGAYDGGALLSKDLPSFVNGLIANNMVPKDDQGLYLILASPKDLDTGLSCNWYCGFHQKANADGGTNPIYGVVMNTGMCPYDCSGFPSGSATPNNSLSADTMVSVIAHEIAEVATDPGCGNGWTNVYNSEVGDVCAWSFGNTYMLSNGAPYNVEVGNRKFLIQQIWTLSDSSKDHCVLDLGNGPGFDTDAAIPTLADSGVIDQPNGTLPFLYFGGPVLSKPIHVYWLWLGNWPNRATIEPIITDFVNGLGTSSWWGAVAPYFDEPTLFTDGGLSTE